MRNKDEERVTGMVGRALDGSAAQRHSAALRDSGLDSNLAANGCGSARHARQAASPSGAGAWGAWLGTISPAVPPRARTTAQ